MEDALLNGSGNSAACNHVLASDAGEVGDDVFRVEGESLQEGVILEGSLVKIGLH